MSAKKQPCPVAENMWLVHRIARRYRWSVGGAVALDDLIQAGAVALMKAAARYSPELCPTLARYAGYSVERAIQRFITEQRRTVHVPAAKQRAAWRRGKAYPLDLLSLDAPAVDDNPESGSKLDRMPAVGDLTDEIDAARTRRRIAAALGRIPERSRHVLVARFYGDESLEEVGAGMGVTRERVRQLQNRALGQLRQTLGAL